MEQVSNDESSAAEESSPVPRDDTVRVVEQEEEHARTDDGSSSHHNTPTDTTMDTTDNSSSEAEFPNEAILEQPSPESASDVEQPSSPVLQEIDEDEDEHDHGDEAQKQYLPTNGQEAWTILRKGAVAVAGGTMVGVGLVMIPLPTPFGAVVASSGLAVLGTEFDGAAKMNERLVETATGHLETAREHVIRRMEQTDENENNTDGNAKPQTVFKRTGNMVSRTVLSFLQRPKPRESGATGDAQSSTDSSWEETGHILTNENDGDAVEEEPLDGTYVIVRDVEQNSG